VNDDLRAQARAIADELRAVAAFGLNFARPGSFDAERYKRRINKK